MAVVSYSYFEKINYITPQLEKISFGSIAGGSNIGYRFLNSADTTLKAFYNLGTETDSDGNTIYKGLNIVVNLECLKYNNIVSIGIGNTVSDTCKSIVSIGTGNTVGENNRNNISVGNSISTSGTCEDTVSIGSRNTIGENSINNILLGNSISIPNECENSVYIGNNINLNKSYPLDIAAGGNHLRMDSDGALSFEKVILGISTSISKFTLTEYGLFIINFSTSSSLDAVQYTAILSRVTSPRENNIYATDSGGYRLECTGDGKIIIYDSNGDLQLGCYLKKIIKIMSY